MATRHPSAFPLEGSFHTSQGPWPGRNVLAVRVRGGAMADEGLRDGDVLVVEPGCVGATGQTVVAEVDGALTVKRLHRERGGRVRLQPADPQRLPLLMSAERVRVIGRVVGVLRRRGFRRTGAPGRAHASRPAARGDLALAAAIGAASREAERLAAALPGRSGAPLRQLGRSLRGLGECYRGTTTPRLRQALLREAETLLGRLREFGVEPPASV